MVALRLAATLVHALPGLSLRLGDGCRTLLEVAHPPLSPSRVMAPCLFRTAVGRAHHHTKAGARVGFYDLADHTDPVVHVEVPAGGHVLPGGIYRVLLAGSQVDAFVTTLSPAACRDIVTRQGPAVLADLRHPLGARFLADPLTEVTLVHRACPAGPVASGAPSALEDLLAGCLADEVVHQLARSSHC